MPTADFCAINSNFDSHLVAGVPYKRGTTYVLRFVLDRWEPQVPSAFKLLALAQVVGGSLAACDHLKLYQMKALVMRKAQPGESVQYFTNHWYSTGIGSSGCNETLTAGDGTWILDLVFEPLEDATYWGAPEKKFIEYFQKELAGTRGVPEAHLAGVVPLVSGAAGGGDAYEAAVAFWSAKKSFWQFQQTASEIKESGLGFSWSKINYAPPMNAWASYPFMGEGGVGISLGDAFDPKGLQPLKTEGTIQPGQENTNSWIDPGTSIAALTSEKKALGVAAGVMLGWFFGKRFLGW